VRRLHRSGDVGREGESTGGKIAGDQRLEAWFVDRHLAGVQAGDLAFVNISAGHVVAGFREASARDQANITRSNNSNFHRNIDP
jgi:hypothetical protein